MCSRLAISILIKIKGLRHQVFVMLLIMSTKIECVPGSKGDEADAECKKCQDPRDVRIQEMSGSKGDEADAEGKKALEVMSART